MPSEWWKGKTEGVSEAYMRRKSRCQGPGAGASLVYCKEQTGGLLVTAAPCSRRHRWDCALRSLTSPERNGLDGLARQERAVRRGQRGEAGSRETDWGGSCASPQQAEQAVSGPAGSQDDGEGGCLWMLCRRAGSWEQRGREPGRRQLLFLADRAALRGAESHSGHFSNTCAVRKILIHDVGDN